MFQINMNNYIYMSNNTCTSLYNNFKRFYMNVPPGSRNQIVSPYTNSTLDVSGPQLTSITQYDLNMRRKAEILQYKKNSSNNARVSKRELFSRVARNTKNYNLNSNCNNTDNIPTPSSSSNIPGKIINIELKPEVPLYMYNTTSQFNEIFEED